MRVTLGQQVAVAGDAVGVADVLAQMRQDLGEGDADQLPAGGLVADLDPQLAGVDVGGLVREVWETDHREQVGSSPTTDGLTDLQRDVRDVGAHRRATKAAGVFPEDIQDVQAEGVGALLQGLVAGHLDGGADGLAKGQQRLVTHGGGRPLCVTLPGGLAGLADDAPAGA